MKACIVSAYYKIPSKQPHAFYFQHLLRFFQGSKNKQIIFFTTPDVIEEFAKYLDLSHIRFICLKFSDFEAIQKFGRYFWDRQKQRDSAYFHTAELGAIWFEKKEFVLRAAEIVPDADVYVSACEFAHPGLLQSPIGSNAQVCISESGAVHCVLSGGVYNHTVNAA